MGKKGKMPDMNLPIWFDGQNINEALFCEEFLQERRIIFANGAFFTPDGRVTDDLPLRGEIYDKLKFCAVNNIPRKITNILEVLKLEAQVPDFPPEQDRIHVSNGAVERSIHRGQNGYCAKPSACCLQSRSTRTCDLVGLSEWAAPCRGHPHVTGVYRLLPDSLQQGTAYDGD